MKRKHIKRYFIDYSFTIIFVTIFNSSFGLVLWNWSYEQITLYITSTIFITLVSGRLFGALLNKWRGLFGEREQ